MKKLSRILAIVMALVIVLGVSVASAAAPTNISQIENLPELPEYPTMKVKTVKGTTTLTLSAPLTWLNVIQNWNWMDIITWNEDKTVGTYSTAGLKSAVGTGTYMGHWLQSVEEDKDFAYRGVYAINADVSAAYVDKKGNPDNYTGVDNGEFFADYGRFASAPIRPCPDTWDIEHTDINGTHAHLDSWVGGYYQEDYVVHEKWDYNFDVNGVQLVWRTKESIGMYCGWYDMGFAYDGGLQDGSDIKYTASGKVASITVTKTGENYLGSENAPVKSEVTFKWLYGRPYISEIKETFDDDSTLTATFAFNGSRIKLH